MKLRLGLMLMPSKDAEMVENAIERRLVETRVSGGVRPFRSAAAMRTANPAGAGLFLVKTTAGKPGQAGMQMVRSSRLERVKNARAARIRAVAGAEMQERKSPGRVLPMRLEQRQARQERLLGVMAALGPVFWFGHAALVWLKVV